MKQALVLVALLAWSSGVESVALSYDQTNVYSDGPNDESQSEDVIPENTVNSPYEDAFMKLLPKEEGQVKSPRGPFEQQQTEIYTYPSSNEKAHTQYDSNIDEDTHQSFKEGQSQNNDPNYYQPHEGYVSENLDAITPGEIPASEWSQPGLLSYPEEPSKLSENRLPQWVPKTAGNELEEQAETQLGDNHEEMLPPGQTGVIEGDELPGVLVDAKHTTTGL